MLKKLKENYLRGLMLLNQEIGISLGAIYIGIIIDMIAIMYLMKLKIFYAILLIMHTICLFYLGYKKDCCELSPKEIVYQRIYYLCSFIIIITGIVLAKSLMFVLVLIVPVLISSVLFFVIVIFDLIITKTVSLFLYLFGSKKSIDPGNLWEKYYAIIFILITFPVYLLPISFTWKSIITIAYLVSIPLLAYGTDNGMDFFSVYSKCFYDDYMKLKDKQENN